jgi:zinc knuckle protein
VARNEVEIRGYYELRKDLMQIADRINEQRLELAQLQRQLAEVTTQLVAQSDKLFTRALGELDRNGEPKREVQTRTNVQAVAEHVKPHRRTCSVCGEPGHRAPNCPDQKQAREEKKSRKPLSEERKAQLRETLKKAREARGKKGGS